MNLIMELRNSYRRGAALGARATAVHLFGIRHATELADISLTRLVRDAGLLPGYAAELRKGIELAPYVRAARTM